ncbi:cytochrome P450 CYP12A2-like [Venturia canescens]|uniref:cytochrome P450 CYP12A2-like n=1 Tax=Venturia canescens TaxID=32260 RepID=UPI001C9C1243|nr:cytochrome P450 CYP12A2-like [Venturia canescens]
MQPRRVIGKIKDIGRSTRSNSTADVCPVAAESEKNFNAIRPFKDIPGPKGLPLVGNLFRFIPGIGRYGSVRSKTILQMLRQDFGDIVRLEDIWTRSPTVYLFNVEDCEKMYRVEGPFPSRLTMETLKVHREMNASMFNGYLGLASSQGEAWHKFRSNVNPYMMQPHAIMPHVAQVDQVSGEFVEKMRKLRDAETLKLPPSFNNEMHKWALESICAIALDHRMGCLSDDLSPDSDPQRMINAVHVMFDSFFVLEVKPSLWKYYKTRKLRRLFAALDSITSISVKYVDAAKERFNARNEEEKRDRARHKSILENSLNIDEGTGYILALDMLAGGIDTTSNTAGSMLYYIASNPPVQEKLREEVLRALPDKNSPVTYEILKSKIPYLKACVKESLRLSPIAFANLRTMTKDVVIGGYEIPAGINVLAIHGLLSQESAHFPNPEAFLPERWLRDSKGVASAKDTHPFVYMPFGFGARTCIGRRFAQLEIETLALKVFRNFKVEWKEPPLKIKTRFINTIDSPLEFTLIDL